MASFIVESAAYCKSHDSMINAATQCKRKHVSNKCASHVDAFVLASMMGVASASRKAHDRNRNLFIDTSLRCFALSVATRAFCFLAD